MVSDIQLSGLTEQQTVALKLFRNRCELIGTVTFLLAMCGWLTFFLASAFYVRAFAVIFFSITTIYLLLMLIVMRRQTGLWWHFLNAYPGWIVAPVAMASLTLWAIIAFQSAVRPSSWFTLVGPIAPLIAVLSSAAIRWVQLWTRVRAEGERVRYGEHWLSLGRLSFWDILLIRIPHERA